MQTIEKTWGKTSSNSAQWQWPCPLPFWIVGNYCTIDGDKAIPDEFRPKARGPGCFFLGGGTLRHDLLSQNLKNEAQTPDAATNRKPLTAKADDTSAARTAFTCRLRRLEPRSVSSGRLPGRSRGPSGCILCKGVGPLLPRMEIGNWRLEIRLRGLGCEAALQSMQTIDTKPKEP